MRLFWALEPPTEVINELQPAAAALAAAHPDLRWTKPATWHVTLAFLGDVPDTAVGALVQVVADELDGEPPVHVVLSGQAGAPDGRPGVVWLPVTGEPAVAGLADRVRSASATVVSADVSRQWRGHLTLARTPRRITDGPRRAREVAAEHAGAPASWTADAISLVSSQLRPEGPSYETVATVALAGTAA